MKAAEQSEENRQSVDMKLEIPFKDTCAETCCQNKRYISNQLLNKYTPDKKCCMTYCSPLQTLREKTKQEFEWISTPTGSTSKSFVVPCNPFDVDVESLSMSSFSPSVFTVTRQKSQESLSFRWSIEQLAVLEPADIDENSHQDLWFDKEKEIKAQKAIDVFFSKKCIVPSPWTPTTKYLSCSPHAISSPRPLHKEQRKAYQKHVANEVTSQAKEISTQTTLTIPPNLDLMALLDKFYTFENDESDVSFNSFSSYNDVDVLSSSSLRRKLFMNDDQLQSPFLIKEQSDQVMTSVYETPKPKKSLCLTPSSAHFSSSPITPKCWSLSMNQISMTSPDISPICAVPRKTYQRSRLRTQHERIDEETDKLEKNSLKKPMLEPLATCSNISLGAISETDADSSCSVFWDLSKQDNPARQETCDVPGFPNTYTESSSNHPDTGYLTGSLNSMIGQQMSVSQFRITPVAELLEDCAISKLSQQQFQHHQCNMKNCSECSKALENDDSAMMTSLSCDQSSVNPGFFAHVPWNPPGFSTPTEYSGIVHN